MSWSFICTPKWQRQIVGKLMTTFPRCQFIATSHSPQVVASVDPEQVHLLTPDGVIRPDRSRGMDSNWILRHLMEADDRPMDAKAILESVERAVAEGFFADARETDVGGEAGRDSTYPSGPFWRHGSLAWRFSQNEVHQEGWQYRAPIPSGARRLRAPTKLIGGTCVRPRRDRFCRA